MTPLCSWSRQTLIHETPFDKARPPLKEQARQNEEHSKTRNSPKRQAITFFKVWYRKPNFHMLYSLYPWTFFLSGTSLSCSNIYFILQSKDTQGMTSVNSLITTDQTHSITPKWYWFNMIRILYCACTQTVIELTDNSCTNDQLSPKSKTIVDWSSLSVGTNIKWNTLDCINKWCC